MKMNRVGDDFVDSGRPTIEVCPRTMNLHEIRELAAAYSAAELDRMIESSLAVDPEGIITDPLKSERFGSLVKARTVRLLMESGLPLHDAVRELGRTMRNGVGKRKDEG